MQAAGSEAGVRSSRTNPRFGMPWRETSLALLLIAPLATATLHAPSQATTATRPSAASHTTVRCCRAILLRAQTSFTTPSLDAYSACLAPLHPSARSPTFPTTPTAPCLLQPPRKIPSHRQLTCCGRRLHRRRHRHVADWRRASCQAKRLARLTEAQAWTH